MKGIHNTYCNKDVLDAIIKGRKKEISYSIAYTMLNKLSNIIVDMPDNDLHQLIKSDQVYNTLNKRENKSIKSKAWIEGFCPTDSKYKCDDVFLVDKDDIKGYKNVRQEYGCLIISNDKDDLKIFDRAIKDRPFNLVPDNERINDPTIKYHIGWTHFFSEFKLTPLNAVIITDNFMFGDKFEGQKNKSLFAILKSIAPKGLKQDFHITIFFNNSPNSWTGKIPLTKEDAELLVKEIKNLNLCDSVKVTIVAHSVKSTTHDRELITNYHYMYSGCGFGVVDENGVTEVAKGQVQHVFCGMDYSITIKQIQAQAVMWLKSIFNKERGGDSRFSYIVGDKVNRLFE